MTKSFFSPRRIIDRYFLEVEKPYSHRRPIRMKTVYWTLGIFLFIFIFSVIWLGRDDPDQRSSAQPDFHTHQASNASSTNSAVSVGDASSVVGGSSAVLYSTGGGFGARSIPTHMANQVISRGANGTDPGAGLPLGSTFPVRLVNAILSTESTTPVIAEVIQDIYSHGVLSIPAATHAIGTAQYNEASRRIQLNFQALVYPDGDQHAVQAMGMMPDGSAGLSGNYHSGEAKRQVGRFLGHFASGMADGMKDRKSAAPMGKPYEPGSIKNGLLNGVMLSSEDQAKSITAELNSSRASMSLAAGQTFILFLEREYVP